MSTRNNEVGGGYDLRLGYPRIILAAIGRADRGVGASLSGADIN